MKQRTSFVKRCLAFALALVLLVSQANMGLVQYVRASEYDVNKTIAEIIADYYDLTEAEKNLLKSGYLVSESFGYNVPTDGDNLVSIDTENKKISAENKYGWAPSYAQIVVGQEVKENVTLTEGKGSYEYAGNAFSVKVYYVLNTTVAASVQETLLGAGAILKQGVKNLDDVKAQSGNLYILEQAMPELVNLAENGIETSFTTVQLNCKDAVLALNEQMTANEGKLNLSVMIGEYEAGTKTGYLMTKGTAMQAEVADLVTKVQAISTDLNTIYDNIEWLINGGFVSAELANQLKILSGNCQTLADGLATVNADPWTAANTTNLVKADANYADLDTLVAALGEASAANITETLKVAETSVQTNLSMWNVTYRVVLNHVKDNVVVEAYSDERVETLADKATAAEIIAAFAGYEDGLLAKWNDVYVADKFDRDAKEFPATLTDDLVYVVTYSPKNYTVTIAGESASYPYGYELTLPNHPDSSKSYDYWMDGTYYAQGSVVTVENDMTFTREEGKAYTGGSLYAIVADNYGTDKIAAILTSGAVKGDEAISYREPSKAELENLVKLDGNVLTVQSYASSYAGLSWAPYSYVVDGAENLFNGATEVTISGDFEKVAVYYRLTMTNHAAAEVKEILDLAATLADEAEGQKNVMDKLASFEDQMSQLSKNMLTGLSAVIGNYTTANGGGLNPDPVKNDELVAYFQATIAEIATKCCEGQNLKLYNIIQAYNDPNNGGLLYYYKNDATVRNEISVLSFYLNDMLDGGDRQAALEKLMAENGYADKVDVLDTLGTKLAEIEAELKPVNANIDTTDAAKLSALATALSMTGSVEVAEYGNPYVEMGPVNRIADKYVAAEVKVIVNGKSATFTTDAILKGTALTQAQINDLTEAIFGFVTSTVEPEFYSNNYNDGSELYALVGVALDKNVSFEYTWTAKEYTVKIAGEADQIVTVNNLTITLPEHPDAYLGMSYEYTIGSKTANSGIYTFTKDELRTLFVGGELTITRVEKNANLEQLEKMVATINHDMGFEALTLVAENGLYTGIEANIAASDMMNLMMGLVLKSGYGYIGLNNEGFIYANDKAELELSMQTLINAMLNDEEFSNNTIIALADNGKGKVLTASMQLGNSASELSYTDLTFTLNLKSVPEALVNYAEYIKLVSKYITFKSNNGEMAFELNLPDQAYAAYAAALVATGNVAKNDVNGLTQKVPVQFLYDYLTAVTGSEMDLVTFTNTLEMLGFGTDLTAYNNAYNKAMGAYNKYVTVSIDDEKTAVGLNAPGKQSINGLLKLLGISTEGLSTYLGMLKEYKDGNYITFNATGKLVNVDKTYYALVLDAQADGVTNKMEAPSSYNALAKELKELAGYSYVILTADVPGDLTIAGNTVLDLNGFDVDGTINATGKLIIMDSLMGNNTAGTVGNVTGNATIVAGCYKSDVSSKLLTGCYLENGMVRNAMYQIVEDEAGNLNFVLDGNFLDEMQATGYLPNAKALAINIASDVVMNYANTAKIALGGYELVAMDIDDLVGLYASDNRITELAKTLLGCFTIGEEGYENNAGFEGVVNMILADLLDFGAITEALNNNTALFTYELTTAPWTIEIDHNEERDYATLDVRYNADLEKTINVSLTVESKFNDNVAAMTEELSKIVVADQTFAMIDLPTPTYSDKTLTISGAAKASVVMDMSENSDYVTVIGVILGYGNADKAAAIAEALNAGDMAAMKKIVDNTSVEEIFTALKKLARNVNFAAMAEKVGVTVDVASAAELEAKFHLVLCAAGKVLEELDITGMNSKLGGLYNEETGYYELTKENIFRDKEINVRSYSALIELEATLLNLQVKLFSEIEEEPDCLWGDADHDGVVDQHDASLVFAYYMGTLAEGETICMIRTDVDCNGVIDQHDASLILEYYLGKIDMLPVEG